MLFLLLWRIWDYLIVTVVYCSQMRSIKLCEDHFQECESCWDGEICIAKEDPVLSLLSANYSVLFSVSKEKPAH